MDFIFICFIFVIFHDIRLKEKTQLCMCAGKRYYFSKVEVFTGMYLYTKLL